MAMSSTLLWLLAGIVLCVMEALTPTAFVELIMGISALIVAVVSLILPQLSLQIALWMFLSLSMVVGTRRLLPKRKVYAIEAATEAETLTELLPGQAGRVLYEGNSWRARCEEYEGAIAPNQKVYVLGREGNTLIVAPENLLPP